MVRKVWNILRIQGIGHGSWIYIQGIFNASVCYSSVGLENNDCVTCVFMVLFRNQRLLFWSEEFVPRGAA